MFANFPFCGMQLQHLLLLLCTCSAGGLLHFGVTIDTKLRAWIGNYAPKIGLPAFRFWDEMLQPGLEGGAGQAARFVVL